MVNGGTRLWQYQSDNHFVCQDILLQCRNVGVGGWSWSSDNKSQCFSDLWGFTEARMYILHKRWADICKIFSAYLYIQGNKHAVPSLRCQNLLAGTKPFKISSVSATCESYCFMHTAHIVWSANGLHYHKLTEQTGHYGEQTSSSSNLQHRFVHQVHLLLVVVQKLAQSYRLQDKSSLSHLYQTGQYVQTHTVTAERTPGQIRAP